MLIWKSTHDALIALEQLKVQHLSEKLQDQGKMMEVIADQQRAISRMAQDLVIVRGAGRIQTERKLPENQLAYLDRLDEPIETSEATLNEQHQAVQQARERLEVMLSQGSPEVSPELVAAATPASKEDWENEHEAPVKNFDWAALAELRRGRANDDVHRND